MLNKLKSTLLTRCQNPICGDILISHEHRLLLFINAKCGSGTAKEWFLHTLNVLSDQQISEGRVDEFLGMSVHDYVRNSKTQFCATEQELRHTIHSYSKIIVVRNPWKRVVSFYSDKILIRRNWLPALNVLIKENYSKNMTFREFVRYVDQIPDNALEGHLQSQSHGRENISFDFVVKLEKFSVEMAQVAKALQLPQALVHIHRNRTPYKENITDAHIFDMKPREIVRPPPYQYFYDQELHDIVRAKYRRDIERFNYEFQD